MQASGSVRLAIPHCPIWRAVGQCAGWGATCARWGGA